MKAQQDQLIIYNSLKGEKEPFIPMVEGKVGMYVCGPTLYSEPHMGNMRTFINFDLIYRYLLHLGFSVKYVRNITDAGAVSAQERNQVIAAEKSAQARLLSARALQTQQEIRLRNTTVTALDDGVISARTATLGSVPAPGQELFRLVRQQRLEWQAEVTDAELARISEGMAVTVFNNDQALSGKVRTLSPVINAQSRTGMVYVDIPGAYAKGLKPGMYLRGEFDLGAQTATVIPQTAVIERDGFTYAFTLDQASSKVQRIKLRVNKAQGEFIEVLEGLSPGDKVVKSGVAFLAHGDLVKVVQ